MPKATKPSVKPKVVAKNTNSFFKPVQTEEKAQGCVQNVNVEINIDRSEDGCTGCFKALASVFKRG